jgi:protein-tyrosine phosphatase
MNPVPARPYLSAPVNLRDLGGISIGGGRVRSGFAIRSDDLSVVTPAVARALVEGGLTTVIDLRTPDECALTGRGPLGEFPVAYHHLPLMTSIIPAGRGRGPISLNAVSMGEMYADLVDTASAQLAAALSIIALSPGATAFHCAAGRDRTGVLAALLLLALDATDDAVVDDYVRTDANMVEIRARMEPVMGALLERMGFDLDELTRTTVDDGPMELSMRTMLALLRDRHGDCLAPVRDAGLSPDTVGRLRWRAAEA